MQSHCVSSKDRLSPQYPCAPLRYMPSCRHVHAPEGWWPMGCQPQLPAPSWGWETKRQGQPGDLGITALQPLCLRSPLPAAKTGMKPACSARAHRGDGFRHGAWSHRDVWGQDQGSHQLHWKTAGTAWANMLDAPLPSCQLRFELLLRLTSPPSPCLHPSAGGFASS